LNPPLQTPAKGPRTLKTSEQTPTVTVVICTRNRPALLQKCLAAVARLSTAPTQVLVVDNSEGNSDTRKVAQDYGARYIIEPVRGLCRARNRALAECQTEVVAFLDDDVAPAPDWLALLLAPFANDRIGASAGRVITPDILDTEDFRQQRALSDQDPHWFEIATFGGLGLGANMALRKRACAAPRLRSAMRATPLPGCSHAATRSSISLPQLFIIRRLPALHLIGKLETPSPTGYSSSASFRGSASISFASFSGACAASAWIGPEILRIPVKLSPAVGMSS
jgi:cellulose synthase/poly-beta-1,6-N-acetylglucosamine synthase-like glycosyltransferase